MIEAIALIAFMVLLEGMIITLILSVYTETSFRESWSWAWQKPWVPVVLVIANLLAEAT